MGIRMADDRNIRTDPVKVYLCDGNKPCRSSFFCGIENPDRGADACYHTRNLGNAKNLDKEMKFEILETGDEWEIEDPVKD